MFCTKATYTCSCAKHGFRKPRPMIFSHFPWDLLIFIGKTESHCDLNSFKYEWIIQWYSCNEHIPACHVASNDALLWWNYMVTSPPVKYCHCCGVSQTHFWLTVLNVLLPPHCCQRIFKIFKDYLRQSWREPWFVICCNLGIHFGWFMLVVEVCIAVCLAK